MQFSRIVSLFAFFLTFGVFTFASPIVGFEKRDNASIEAVFNALKASTDTILPQITALGSSGNVTEDGITPLITELTTALNTATSALSASDITSLAKRQSGDELADLVAGIVEDVVNALDTLVGSLSTIPALAGLLAGVDAALANLLHSVELLVANLLTLVAQLLTNVAGLLRDLSFDLTLAALGF